MASAAEPADHHGHLARRLLIAGAVFAMLVIALLFVRAWIGATGVITTDDATLETDLTPVAARVAGLVRAVPAADFQVVRQGAVLAEIDDRDYRAALAKAEADVATATAVVAASTAQASVAMADLAAARAGLGATEATLSRNTREAARQARLLTDGVGSQQALDAADAAKVQNAAQIRQGEAGITSARAKLQVIAAQVGQARAALAAAQAARDLARLNLGYTRVTAPADGTVGVRQVRPGQFVPAGGTVFVLAPRTIWVIANFKETQLPRARVGQPARITVDALPGHVLKGRVVAFAPASGAKFALIPPDNATGNFTKIVQRVAVKIALTDADGMAADLRAGLSVTATIDTTGGR